MTRPSPFAALETTFRLLSQPPDSVVIDGRRVGHGAPDRPIPIGELRTIALHPATTNDLQNAVLDEVIAGLPEDPATWTVVLGGILLPAMRCQAERLAADGTQTSRLGIEAELLWRLAAATHQPPAATRQFAMCLLAQHGREPGGPPRLAPTGPSSRSREDRVSSAHHPEWTYLLATADRGATGAGVSAPGHRPGALTARIPCPPQDRLPVMAAYLTAQQVAQRLQVSVSWVYKHKGLLGAVRIGERMWRFPEDQLRTFPGRTSSSPAVAKRAQRTSAPGPAAHDWHLKY